MLWSGQKPSPENAVDASARKRSVARRRFMDAELPKAKGLLSNTIKTVQDTLNMNDIQ
jgi:hypothetical protein